MDRYDPGDSALSEWQTEPFRTSAPHIGRQAGPDRIWQAGRAGAAGQYGYDYNVAQDLPPDAVTPWAQSVRQQRVQNFRKDSPLSHCEPVSVPFLNFRGLSRIVQTPGLIVILYESPNSPHRTIFMDGATKASEKG